MTDNCRGNEDCRKLQELLGDYLDEELKAAICEELDRHLEACPDCRVHVDSVRKVIHLYREASQVGLPVDISIRLQDVIRRARDSRERG